MNITQEQAKIIHEWFSKLLASDPSKVRGSDFELAHIIRDASQQSVQADFADSDLNLNLPPISSTRYRLVRVEPPNR